MFVGHGRSGSTIVGALLNAHPNIVMSNELNILKHLETETSQREIFALIYHTAKRNAKRGSIGGGEYRYSVPNQWQGRHKDLLVIGDRKAGATANIIFKKPNILDRLDTAIHLDKKFIFVVRNPFDTISTTFHKTHRKPNEKPEEHLRREIGYYFDRYSAVQILKNRFGSGAVKHVYHETFLSDPQQHLRELCGFLRLDYTIDYLVDSAAIVRNQPNKTRFSVDWTGDLIRLVRKRMADFPLLQSYSFES